MKIRMLLMLYAASSSIFVTTGFPVFTSEENELIYDYNVVATVGTKKINNYATKFYLTGKLHIQREGSSLLLRLSGLTFKLYNGLLRDGYEDIMDEIPISNEYEDLLRIFKINYDLNGHVDNLTTETRENVHARNIKKSIASILEIDLRCMNGNGTQKFSSDEVSYFNNSTAFYNVTNIFQGLIIEKYVTEELVSTTSESCPINDKYSLNNTLRYFVNDTCTVAKVESTGTLSDKNNFIELNQTLELIETDLVTERFQIYDEETQSLAYTIDELVLLGITKQTVFSGFEIRSSAIYNTIQELMLELINTDRENVLKVANFVQQLLHLLRSFDTLEPLYQRIADWSLGNKQYLAIVHQLLPFVGTRSSHLLIKQLVRSNSVSERTALDLITDFPFHLAANVHIDDLEDLLYFDDSVSTLSFATILSQTNSTSKCASYIKYFTEKFDTSFEYDTKLRYMVAASNSDCTEAQFFLISIMRNSSYSITLRRWAMRRLPRLLKPKQALFDILWPIFKDAFQVSNLRKTAYILMMESKLPPSKLLRIHNQIETDENEELYEFHYSYLSALSKTNDLCLQDVKESLTEILDLVQKRNRTKPTGHYELVLDVGLTAYLTYDKNSTFILFKVSDNVSSNSLLMNVDGAQATFDSGFKRVTLLVPDLTAIKIDVMLTHKDYVTQIMCFNISNLHSLERVLSLFLNEDGVQLKYKLHHKTFTKTNFGIPFEAEMSEIAIRRQNWSVYKKPGNLLSVQVKGCFNNTDILLSKLQFYNPLADTWQGVKSHQTKRSKINVSVGVDVLVHKSIYKVSFNIDLNQHIEDYNNSVNGIFVNECAYYNEVLSKSCESCQNWYVLE